MKYIHFRIKVGKLNQSAYPNIQPYNCNIFGVSKQSNSTKCKCSFQTAYIWFLLEKNHKAFGSASLFFCTTGHNQWGKLSNNFAMPFSLKLTTTKKLYKTQNTQGNDSQKNNWDGCKKKKIKNQKQTPYYPCLLLDHEHVDNPALDYSVFLSILLWKLVFSPNLTFWKIKAGVL